MVVLLLLPATVLGAERTAPDLSEYCQYRVSPGVKDAKETLTDGVLVSHVRVQGGGSISLSWDEQVEVRGLWIVWAQQSNGFVVEQYNAAEQLIASQENDQRVLEQVLTVDEAAVRVVISSEELMDLSELWAVGEGESGLYPWQPANGESDCMVIAAQPMDALSIMGGVITAAVERDLELSVVCAAEGGRARTALVLSALAHLELGRHPILLNHSSWDDDYNENTVITLLVRELRRQRPTVVITHNADDAGRERRLVARAAVEAVELAADANYDPSSAEEYGVWQVQSLYCHGAGEVSLELSTALSCYEGQSALERLSEAFALIPEQREFPAEPQLEGGFDLGSFAAVFTGETQGEDPFLEPVPTTEPTAAPTQTPTVEPEQTMETEAAPSQTAMPEHATATPDTASVIAEPVASIEPSPAAAQSGTARRFSLSSLLSDRTLLIVIASVSVLIGLGINSAIKTRNRRERRSRKPRD